MSLIVFQLECLLQIERERFYFMLSFKQCKQQTIKVTMVFMFNLIYVLTLFFIQWESAVRSNNP